jgi:hypothetical protein
MKKFKHFINEKNNFSDVNEPKIKLLEYITKNYDKVVIPAKYGEFIEIDLIPGSHDGLHDLSEIIESCEKMNIDTTMFTRSYPNKIGDGIRMGRYMYFMQETTKDILADLKKLDYKIKNNE